MICRPRIVGSKDERTGHPGRPGDDGEHGILQKPREAVEWLRHLSAGDSQPTAETSEHLLKRSEGAQLSAKRPTCDERDEQGRNQQKHAAEGYSLEEQSVGDQRPRGLNSSEWAQRIHAYRDEGTRFRDMQKPEDRAENQHAEQDDRANQASLRTRTRRCH